MGSVYLYSSMNVCGGCEERGAGNVPTMYVFPHGTVLSLRTSPHINVIYFSKMNEDDIMYLLRRGCPGDEGQADSVLQHPTNLIDIWIN